MSELLGAIATFLRHTFEFSESSPLLFTQFYFWAFFAIVYALFAPIARRTHLRNAFLFFVSLFFYYKTSGIFVLILMFVTCSDFLIARRIHASDDPRRRKAWLITSITIDLFLLCYFKYAYFFTDMVNDIFGTQLAVHDYFAEIGNLFAGDGRFLVDQIVLPVGISFFTFQIISYTVDVYKKKIEPVSNVLDFGFYVSFFPQLVAGPIVRASEFIPQLYKPFFLSRRQFGVAVFWILNGLIKKIVLSDYIAVNFIDRVFDNPLLFTGFENFMALIGYSLQVYADFSGYTDIAIGVAMLMGFYLPKNFNSPYKAPNASNFWKRWHISLSMWLQTYLYIPLGGNRNASFGTFFWIGLISLIALILTSSLWASATILGIAAAVIATARLYPEKRKKIIANINAFITMLLGGLWHGASWNFMIWGGLNGVGMIVFKFWRDMRWRWRMAWLYGTCLLLMVLCVTVGAPVFNMLLVWMICITLGTNVRFIYHMLGGKKDYAWLANAWAVTQTFIFITFTRLFFRSGSNLDPATANEVAWNTAKNMVNQIGSGWSLSTIPDVCAAYYNVFLLIVLGMIIHWLPDRWKRRYRIAFARLPLAAIVSLCIATALFVYQFITADLQAFIYFQF
ncbi:MAG: MBOAT family protein [Muribaculaceae bacterium]|nr:MBOAT family protein [Muribaculaceae bacterium]